MEIKIKLLELLNIDKKNEILNLNNINISIVNNDLLFNGYLVYNKYQNIYDLNHNELVLAKHKTNGKIYIINSNEVINVNTDICAVVKVVVNISKYWYDGHGGHDVEKFTKTYFIASDIQNPDVSYVKKILEKLNSEIGSISVISVENYYE